MQTQEVNQQDIIEEINREFYSEVSSPTPWSSSPVTTWGSWWGTGPDERVIRGDEEVESQEARGRNECWICFEFFLRLNINRQQIYFHENARIRNKLNTLCCVYAFIFDMFEHQSSSLYQGTFNIWKHTTLRGLGLVLYFKPPSTEEGRMFGWFF